MPRPKGMHPNAYEAYLKAFADSGMPPFRIVQTCTGALQGRVAASAGTHDADGKLPSGEQVAACVDLSTWRIRGVRRWDEAHIKWALFNLADEGFAGFYRYRGSFAGTKRHMHLIYVGMHMKPMVQRQVEDFIEGRDGLAGHHTEPFWRAPRSVDDKLKALFLQHNPEARSRF